MRYTAEPLKDYLERELNFISRTLQKILDEPALQEALAGQVANAVERIKESTRQEDTTVHAQLVLLQLFNVSAVDTTSSYLKRIIEIQNELRLLRY